MQRIEKGDENNTALAGDLIQIIDTSDRIEEEAVVIPPYEEIPMPKEENLFFLQFGIEWQELETNLIKS